MAYNLYFFFFKRDSAFEVDAFGIHSGIETDSYLSYRDSCNDLGLSIIHFKHPTRREYVLPVPVGLYINITSLFFSLIVSYMALERESWIS